MWRIKQVACLKRQNFPSSAPETVGRTYPGRRRSRTQTSREVLTTGTADREVTTHLARVSDSNCGGGLVYHYLKVIEYWFITLFL